MQILVIDGQGGGLGARLITQLRALGRTGLDITAVGTNALATSAMLKAGADDAATGENAVIWNAGQAHIILGPIGIIVANAMLGEITPAMAAAVSGSPAAKILIPSSKCSVQIAGAEGLPLNTCIESAVRMALEQD